ncbi:MAG: hypothetical protein IKC46_00865 [Lachnospiraceae bacterium]|nr:hypothetical protein [Lachnospiraceae bacterium]
MVNREANKLCGFFRGERMKNYITVKQAAVKLAFFCTNIQKNTFDMINAGSPCEILKENTQQSF